MKILVTGAKGQLGYKIRQLLSANCKLILTDSDDMDITNPGIVNEVIGREEPKFIIHGAAYTKVDAAEENEELCRRINVYGTENVAKAAKANDATLIYISTDYVFDGKQNTPYSERQTPNPLSVYGMTKYEGEKAVAKICDKYYILRIAWLFGELPEGHPGTNFVETMLRLAKERNELSVVNDQIGSPTYTGDLVEVIDRIASSGYGNDARIIERPRLTLPKTETGLATDQRPTLPYGTYHFSGTGACSWYDFAVEIFKQSNIKIEVKPITSNQYPQKAKRPAYSYLDKSKIEQALAIKVRSWQKMLGEYLDNR